MESSWGPPALYRRLACDEARGEQRVAPGQTPSTNWQTFPAARSATNYSKRKCGAVSVIIIVVQERQRLPLHISGFTANFIYTVCGRGLLGPPAFLRLRR